MKRRGTIIETIIEETIISKQGIINNMGEDREIIITEVETIGSQEGEAGEEVTEENGVMMINKWFQIMSPRYSQVLWAISSLMMNPLPKNKNI